MDAYHAPKAERSKDSTVVCTWWIVRQLGRSATNGHHLPERSQRVARNNTMIGYVHKITGDEKPGGAHCDGCDQEIPAGQLIITLGEVGINVRLCWACGSIIAGKMVEASLYLLGRKD